MKFVTVGAELFHPDGRTDMKQLRVAFRNFATRSKYENLHALSQTLYCILIAVTVLSPSTSTSLQFSSSLCHYAKS